MKKVTIGTRGSALALWQARYVAAEIEKAHPRIKVDLMTIKTQGDKILDAPLSKIGTKGLFTKEIEEALLDQRVDLAVHSMKDLPTDLPAGLTIGAIMKREDPRDVFISRDSRPLSAIKPGERIGTSSLRRRAFILNSYPELDIVSIRGNVDTRLRKIESEGLAGIILAHAGVLRMGFADRVTQTFQPEFMIPAIGQGALAIEIRIDDPETTEMVEHLDHPETAACVRVERAFLRRMGGGCQVPMAAYCIREDGRYLVNAAVVHPDGAPIFRESMTTDSPHPSIGVTIADSLVQKGAAEVLKAVFTHDWEPGPTGDLN
jgi:hydroxymethylbilane synthase